MEGFSREGMRFATKKYGVYCVDHVGASNFRQGPR
jgi:hypothetical protein